MTDRPAVRGAGRARSRSFDDTLSLLRQGYPFISHRSRQLGVDVFDTRLLLEPTTCVTGPAAAEMFYDETRVLRAGAMPSRIRKTLLGRGGVQGLDGAAHRTRKGLLMSVLSSDRTRALAAAVEREWQAAAGRWPGRRIVLLDEAVAVLTAGVCRWAGVPLPPGDVARRARQLFILFDGAGAVGPRHWRSRRARSETERWLEKLILKARARPDGGGDALRTIALHRDDAGRLLDRRVAAVELLNLLRPTVAVAIYITFVALALYRYPDRRPGSDAAERSRFVQEVRRFYPFFPFAAGRASRSFRWHGHYIPEGRRVLLDLYGTCRDPRVWSAPEAFRPERFDGADIGPYALIPQGGGDHYRQHRCAGEWVTIELMKSALDMLLDDVDFRVPGQDLHVDLTRIPTFPASRFVIAAE